MRDWMWLLVTLCSVGQAAEPTPPAPVVVPRWEYAVLAPVWTGQDVSLALETYVSRRAFPPGFDGQPTPQNLSALVFVADGSGELTFPNTAAALTWAGREGWEVVEHLGRGQYLARRPLPAR